MTFKVTQGQPNLLQFDRPWFLLVSVITTLSCTVYEILPRFTVYVTGCDLEMSFSFKTTVEITSHLRFLVHV